MYLLVYPASTDERDIPSGVGICLLYDSLQGVLVFGWVARCNGIGV